MTLEIYSACRRYLERLGMAEWVQQGKPVPTKRAPHRRYCPSEYHRALIDCLNRDDEHGFKQLKGLEGYASVLGL